MPTIHFPDSFLPMIPITLQILILFYTACLNYVFINSTNNLFHIFFYFFITYPYLSSLQLQTYPKYPENPEISKIFNFHSSKTLFVPSSDTPTPHIPYHLSSKTSPSKANPANPPFFIKNLRFFPIFHQNPGNLLKPL